MEKQYNVWFGKRLKEVMIHQGFSIATLSAASGVGRMTISRILQGRYATSTEVRQLADALGISVERLRQKDISLGPEKRDRRRKVEDFNKSLAEALHSVSLALGHTEMGLAYQVLGAVYYQANQYQQSLEAYQKSFHLLKDHEDQNLVYEAYHNLMVNYVMVRDYVSLTTLFEDAETDFHDQPQKLHHFLHLKASILVEYTKQYEEALAIFKNLLDMYIGVDDHKTRRNLCNMGDTCFRMGRYEEAQQYYEMWERDYVRGETNKYAELYNYKDYAKTLLSVGENQRALEIIEQRLAAVKEVGEPKLFSHYLFLYEFLRQNGTAAKQLCDMEQADDHLKMVARMLLYSQQMQKGDDEDALKTFRHLLSEYLILE